MSYVENLWLFFTLLIGIIVVPGMDMLFVLANALTGGKRAGFAAVAGITLGGVFHTLVGALGVGLLLTLAPPLLTVLVLAGAAYMAWIGFTLLRSSIAVSAVGTAKTRSLWVAFRQGAITCILNPKAHLFVLAVYPQFVKPQYGSIAAQALVMGILTAASQIGIYGGLALAAGRSRDFLVSHPEITTWVGRASGALFVAVAAVTAWHGLTTA
jgi:threonine/homoserine/homoserine lactone efflux protein